MKKILLIAIVLSFGTTGFAQRSNLPAASNQQTKSAVKAFSGDETTNIIAEPAKPHVQKLHQGRAIMDTVIGTTTYDLQSNAAVQNRLFKHSDGTMSAAWTYSNSNTLAAPDRGTGYAYYNGTYWSVSYPTARIEPQRNGWPSMSATSAGKEVIVSHNNDAANLYVTTRTTKGTGTWSHTSIIGPSSSGNLWPRMVVGGANGQTVHVISVTTPTANGGVLHSNMDGALTYSRSLDGGTTWDIDQVVLPQLTDADFLGFGGDTYSIDANGDVVAFVLGGFEESVVLMKSIDNGTTWTRTIVYQHPMGAKWDPNGTISDADNDGIADTLDVSDGSMSVLVDNNNDCHITFGAMSVFKDDPVATGVSFFPATSGLVYWNETMKDGNGVPECPVYIADLLDIDGSGTVLDDFQNITQIATYYLSLTSMPSMAVAANGDLFVSYSGTVEGTNNGNGQYYRNIYVMKSTDNGVNWSAPLNVTADDFSEGVFASMARNVDTDIHMVYQRDSEPGLAVRGDQDPFQTNEIVYAKIPVVDISSTSNGITGDFCSGLIIDGIVKNSENSKINIYPNPTNGLLNISYLNDLSGDITVKLINLNGQVAYNQTFKKESGAFVKIIDMNNYAKGVYVLQMNTLETTTTQKVVSY